MKRRDRTAPGTVMRRVVFMGFDAIEIYTYTRSHGDTTASGEGVERIGKRREELEVGADGLWRCYMFITTTAAPN